MGKIEQNIIDYLLFDISIFDDDYLPGTYPHVAASFFKPDVPESTRTVVALEYIFEKQGYCPKDMQWSFDEKKQTFKISFSNVEPFGTGAVASLIKSICNRSKKCKPINIVGNKTLEYTIKIEELNLIVFLPKYFVRGGNLIQEVLRSMKFLDDYYLRGHSEDDVTVRFTVRGQILRMRYEDLSGKSIKSYHGNLRDKFLILTTQDKEMAEYLLSLNSTPEEDRMMQHVRYVLMFEGQPRFGCFESGSHQKKSRVNFEELPWVQTRVRTKKVDAVFGLLGSNE